MAGKNLLAKKIREMCLYLIIVACTHQSLCVCVSVFLHNNSKSNRSMNMKIEYIYTKPPECVDIIRRTS